MRCDTFLLLQFCLKNEGMRVREWFYLHFIYVSQVIVLMDSDYTFGPWKVAN